MHDLADIRTQALALMDELGTTLAGRSLQSMGWTFEFDRAKRRLGICKWKRKGRIVRVISVSERYALVRGWAAMEDVVRHEIAHALDFEIRGCSNHGPRWQALALLTKADPTRLYEGGHVVDQDSKYVGACPKCGHEQPFYRRLSRAYACPACCAKYNSGRYSKTYRLRIVERESGLEVRPPAQKPRKYTAVCPACGLKKHFARKPQVEYACKACCDRHAGGRYDERFEWVVKRNY